MRAIFRISIFAMALAGLAGCASPLYDGRYAWKEGWRSGIVIARTAARNASFLGGPHCSAKAAEMPADSDLVTIKYIRLSRTAWWTGPVAKDSAIRLDDRVYFNLRDCPAGVVRAGP